MNNWIKFDGSDSKTFPEDAEDVLVFIEADGFIPLPIVAFFEKGKFYSSETAEELVYDFLYWFPDIIEISRKNLLTNNNKAD